MFKKVLISSLVVSFLSATTIIEEKEFDLVQSIIPGTKIEKVKASVIVNGMYEAYFEDGSLMYVIPDKRLLFMGEIYTNTGESLTQKSIENYKTTNNIKDPLDESIENLKVVSIENQKYLKELFENGILDFKNKNQKYNIVLFKSLSCPYCKKLDEFLKDKNITISNYLAPTKDSEEYYTSKYNIKDSASKLKQQLEIVNRKIKGFGVPFALIIDKNYNLVDTIHGFDEDKWKRYIDEK
ncbi:thioredoxin fold domain-containing protein [Arcobacter cryaerophilus gv. pseudocryaerophilus]|uniref:disulfide isomerase DsbC N-terminal domain-containing protein n=1 Tax=Aliarcobacter cryaerophilus TaxID=28198 RepID=UPI00112F4AAF|nr:thioredoxin fold domain-containing protein [Aliarcobacter cryaerophilus]MBP6713412.1 thioredoxin fold domain-containing protein [Aliarcobacter sp.]MBP7226475.1 thioredoxin fold domain-containing protein [Aliarcobacter sp.]MBP7748904.1 thioredoxin fold domain-containing protein [Aliarcobacter sp.]